MWAVWWVWWICFLWIGGEGNSGLVNCLEGSEFFVDAKATFDHASNFFKNVGYEIATVKMEFNENMYVSEEDVCVKWNWTRQWDCIPCNYSYFDKSCGTNIDPKAWDLPDTLPPCECDLFFCFSGPTLTEKEIVVNQEEQFNTFFRIPIEDPSKGIRLHLVPTRGERVGYQILPRPSVSIAAPFRGEIIFLSPSILLCPSELENTLQSATLFGILRSTTSPLAARLWVTPADEIEAPPNATLKSDPELQNLALPIPLNSTIPLPQIDFRFFQFILEEDRCYLISISGEYRLIPADGQLLPHTKIYVTLQSDVVNLLQDELRMNLERTAASIDGAFVYSICPLPSSTQENPTVLIFEYSYVTFEETDALYFVRDVTYSPTVKPRLLGALAPSEYEMYLRDGIITECECDQTCHSCQDNPFPTQLFLEDPYFPAPLGFNQPCDYSNFFVQVMNKKMYYKCDVENLYFNSGCDVFQAIPIQEKYNPLFPKIPPYLLFLGTFSSIDSYLPEPLFPNFSNNTIGAMVHLSSDTRQLNYSFLHFENFQRTCKPRITSWRLHTKDLKIPTRNLLPFLEKEEEECDSVDFVTLGLYAENIGLLLSLMSNPFLAQIDGTLLNRTAAGGLLFTVGTLTFTKEYLLCQKFSANFYSFKNATEEIEGTDKCDGENEEQDSCCSIDAAWELGCCVSDERVANSSAVIPISEDISLVKEVCENPHCVEPILIDYRSFFIQVRLQSLCLDSQRRPSAVHSTRECLNQWMGDEEDGYLCERDEDCLDQFSTGSCDILWGHFEGVSGLVGRCVGVRSVMEKEFLECVVRNVPSPIFSQLSILFVGLGFYIPFEERVSLIVEGMYDVLVVDDFVSYYGPMSCRSKAYQMDNNYFSSSCDCFHFRCLLEMTCDVPMHCTEVSLICNSAWAHVRGECSMNNSVCNWDPQLEEEDCLKEEYKCMYCSSPLHCLAFDYDEEVCVFYYYFDECPKKQICIQTDGNITEIDGSDECSSNIIPCGECLDPIEDQLQQIEITTTFFPNLSSGVCIFELLPFNIPSCPFLRGVHSTYDFSSPRGCVTFSNCSEEVICERILGTPLECTTAGGKWFDYPITDPEICVGDQDICFPSASELPFRLPQSIANEEVCEMCYGVPVAPAQWIDCSTSNQIRSLSWLETEMVQTVLSANDTLSYNLLQRYLRLGGAVSAGIGIYEDYECYYETFFVAFSSLVCDCVGDTENMTAAELFAVGNPVVPLNTSLDYYPCTVLLSPTNENSDVNLLYFCPGLKHSILIESTRISNTYEFSHDICRIAECDVAFSSRFVGIYPRQPTTVFGDPNKLIDDPVRNTHGVSVGVVVGSGISFEWGVFDEFDCRVFLTASLFPSSVNGQGKKFTILDYGIQVDNASQQRFEGKIEVRPLNISQKPLKEINFSQSFDEILLEASWDCTPYASGPNTTIFPILREENYEQQKEDSLLSDGETTMFYVFSALFGVCFLGVFFINLVEFLMGNMTHAILLLFGCLLLLFRSIYVAMYAAGPFQDVTLASNILVELPSFFYISFGSQLVMVFSYSYFKIQSTDAVHYEDKMKKKLWFVWFLFQLVLYGVAIAVLVMIELIPNEDGVLIECSHRLVTVVEDRSIDYIRIGYHSILLLLAIIMAISIAKLGKELHKRYHANKIRIFCHVIASGLFFSNLSWVIYSGVEGQTPYFVILLFLFECLPISIVAFLVRPQNVQRNLRMRGFLFTSSLRTSSRGSVSGEVNS